MSTYKLNKYKVVSNTLNEGSAYYSSPYNGMEISINFDVIGTDECFTAIDTYLKNTLPLPITSEGIEKLRGVAAKIAEQYIRISITLLDSAGNQI
jgi:hypothetical protein